MSRIVSKLNLNKTPQLVESNSMIFAKNIKLLKDGSLGQDDSLVNILNLNTNSIEGIDNLQNYNIVGIIPYNTKFYLFIYNGTNSAIVEYDEHTNVYTKCKCNWNYNGTVDHKSIIDGNCVVNLNGDILLNVCEYFEDDYKQIPIKTINLKESSLTDDESLYTQTPKVPLYNLSFIEYYNNNIPAGTYQFFIRYEIRDNFYTDWFPASKELFAGARRKAVTNQGPLQYIDDGIDSGVSFHLGVDKIVDTTIPYKSFQVGFICAHDDTIYARAWKHFPLSATDIYFDTDTEYLTDIEITDLTSSSYGLFNVKNITAFKNKQYISNYIETDFNPTDLIDFRQTVEISLGTKSKQGGANKYYDYDISIQVMNVNEVFVTAVDSVLVPDIVSSLVEDASSYFAAAQEYSYVDNNKGIDIHIAKTESGSTNYNIHNNAYYVDEIPFDPGVTDVDDPPEPENDGLFTNDFDEVAHYFNALYKSFGQNGKFYKNQTSFASNVIYNVYITKFINNGRLYKTYKISFYVKPNYISLDTATRVDNYTLMPGQEYKFYIHFIKETGEHTNGYEIGSLYVDLFQNATAIKNHDILYPIFTFNDALPEGYVGCFITMVHTQHNTSEIFDVRGKYGNNLDLDLMLYSDYDGLQIIDIDAEAPLDTNFEGNYYASYDSSNFKLFGSKGKVELDDDRDGHEGLFVIMKYEGNEKYSQLIQITPFISYTGDSYIYDNYKDLNLTSYICNVSVLADNFNHYVSADDVYTKSTDPITGVIKVEEISENNFQSWLNFNFDGHSPDDSHWIYSNYNLNYVTLTNDLTPQIITKSWGEGANKRTYSGFIIQQQSMLLSEVYELKSMFKSYTRKLYQPFSNTAITKFDNTVRSSILEGDEAKINLFKFNATDYYNVPTDKGIIINLDAVGEAILVHTQDSLYKFTGSNSLMTAGGEDVAMKEGEPFDTGIQEIFGSSYGFGGLQHKSQHILSENGYSFYDSDANVIYLFNGQQQMNVISDDIAKLLNHKPVKDIQFASDYYNDRFFIQITFFDYTFTNLSFNFKSKSFISIHDFKFDESFYTKTKCYFIKGTKEIYVVKDEAVRNYNGLSETEDIYPNKQSFTFVNDVETSNTQNASIVDVILNDDYANVKTLNAVSWVCNLINGFSSYDDIKSKFVAEEDLTPYAGSFLRIYTDSSSTDLIDIHKASNPYALRLQDSYKFPRYNLGQWTLNYFRNILNNTDITQSGSVADNKSLIYGKYIIVRFIFSNEDNFKLEDVNFNIAPYNR